MDFIYSDQMIPQLAKDYDQEDEIAIVGGGASGLVSAYFLTEAGHNPKKITIYERNNYLGGHARTLFLHKVSDRELYVIQDYQLTFANKYKDIFLQFVDHNHQEQRAQVNGNPNVIPVDIGVCGFSVNYRNFKTLLSNFTDEDGIPFYQYDYLEEVSRAISLDNLVLRSDKVLGGQLWRPWNWLRLFRLKSDVKKMVNYLGQKDISHWQTKTIQSLLDDLRADGIAEDGIALLCAFAQVGSGYSDAQFSEISAGYLYTFFMQGNFNNAGENNTTFLHGVSVYLQKLVTHLQNLGVNMQKEWEDTAKHTIFAMQPYDAQKINNNLPPIKRSDSILYIHCDPSVLGNMDTVLSYGSINNTKQATWDLDRMRPNHPDVGAYITFSIPDDEAVLDQQLFKGGEVHLLHGLSNNSHNLYEKPLKQVWQHAVIDLSAEKNRRDIWANHQGKENRYYCSSSYLYSMLHENAVTSALDVVCLLTGQQEQLAKQDFKPSNYTAEIYGG